MSEEQERTELEDWRAQARLLLDVIRPDGTGVVIPLDLEQARNVIEDLSATLKSEREDRATERRHRFALIRIMDGGCAAVDARERPCGRCAACTASKALETDPAAVREEPRLGPPTDLERFCGRARAEMARSAKAIAADAPHLVEAIAGNRAMALVFHDARVTLEALRMSLEALVSGDFGSDDLARARRALQAARTPPTDPGFPAR